MKRFTLATIALALFAIPALADHHKEEKLAKLMDRLEGVWEIEEGKNQGEDLTQEELDGKVIIADNQIVTYDAEDQEIYRATFTISPDNKPVEITMKSLVDGRSVESLGILKFEPEDDELWLCYGLPGSERPEEFKSPGDSENMLFELQRTGGKNGDADSR
jgi:uncharacterized protein (TIGR03067 family)